MSTNASTPCVICRNPIGVNSYGWGGGQNAAPVAIGQCCEHCDNSVVLPARMRDLNITFEQMEESRIETNYLFNRETIDPYLDYCDSGAVFDYLAKMFRNSL
jgi:hypothetical protein